MIKPVPNMKMLRIAAVSLIFLSYFSESFSQSKKELAPGYYVVVGAYASTRENIAQNYVVALNQQGHKAAYGFNKVRNLYFVYLSYFDDLKASLEDMQRVRATQFKNAWVRVVSGDIPSAEIIAMDKIKKTQTSVIDTSETESDKDIAPSENTDLDTVMINSIGDITDNEEIIQYKQMTLGNTEVFLSLFNARNNRIVDGDVSVIDTELAKHITKVKGNEYLYLPHPESNKGQLTLICEAFGYRKVQQEINYPLPLADTVNPFIDLMGTTLVIKFDLVRYNKGDIATLYNVYFFNDAAVMLPESRYEMNSLLQMMQEESYKIRLHGHTNGNYQGRIITTGPTKNFFSLNGSLNSIGSAKDLSRTRAEVIKEYLVTNGIDADRIEVKAWGGKRPLYDKHSANAKRNVRVEVEIIED